MSDNKYTDRLHGQMTFKCNQCDTRITEGEDIWGLCETCAAKIDWDALTGKVLAGRELQAGRWQDELRTSLEESESTNVPKWDLPTEKHTLEPNLTIETIKLDGAREDVGSELAEGKTNIICDIDGTIADVRHRLQFIKNSDGTKKKKPDWDSFNEACWLDKPYPDVIALVERVLGWWESAHNPVGTRTEPLNLYFFSGRNDVARHDTIMWLQEHMCKCGVNAWSYSREVRNDPNYDPKFPVSSEWHDHLLMRSEGDRRPDKIIKLEMAKRAGLTPDNVLCIFDDRQTVVDMWRANGFRVMQVDAWKE